VTLTRVAEVVVAVRDLDDAAAFYRDLLRLPVLEENADELLVGCGLSSLRLVRATTPELEAWVNENGEGLHHLAFETDDASASGELLPPEDNLGLAVALRPPSGSEPTDYRTDDVLNIDHIVISSNDSGACAAHFEQKLGLEIKRKMIRPGTNAQLAFGKLYDIVLEFGGPPEPRPGELRAKYWGVVFTVWGLEEVLERVKAGGLPVGEIRNAVQPGARIATVKAGTGGVPVAFIQYPERR